MTYFSSKILTYRKDAAQTCCYNQLKSYVTTIELFFQVILFACSLAAIVLRPSTGMWLRLKGLVCPEEKNLELHQQCLYRLASSGPYSYEHPDVHVLYTTDPLCFNLIFHILAFNFLANCLSLREHGSWYSLLMESKYRVCQTLPKPGTRLHWLILPQAECLAAHWLFESTVNGEADSTQLLIRAWGIFGSLTVKAV